MASRILPEWEFQIADLLPVGAAINVGRSVGRQIPKAIPRAARGADNVLPILKTAPPQIGAQGDDLARFVASEAAPSVPAAGRTRSYFPTAFAVKGATVSATALAGGGGVYFAGRGIARTLDATKGVPDPTKGPADAIIRIVDTGAGALGGFFQGIPTFFNRLAREPAEGAAAGIQALLVPALLVGGGILLFGALKK